MTRWVSDAGRGAAFEAQAIRYLKMRAIAESQVRLKVAIPRPNAT